ncbi:MAG: DMT family transporter [Gammaproteobacteria bacterium]|nr:DMT family transporter [Gammaproteobacteria bacterium]
MKPQLLILIALVVGGLLALQGMVNAQLGKALSHPLQASFIQFSVGILCLVILMFLFGIKVPAGQALGEIPWYLYTGGLLGIIYVTTVLVLIPRIGVANAVLAIFVGQMLLSISADHFGWFNTPVKTMGLSRTSGCVLLLAGLYLLQARA